MALGGWGGRPHRPVVRCGGLRVPVGFLTDAQAAAFGRFTGAPSQAELERFFFLDDADVALVGARRGGHNRLGLPCR
jgi:hypothetical protein